MSECPESGCLSEAERVLPRNAAADILPASILSVLTTFLSLLTALQRLSPSSCCALKGIDRIDGSLIRLMIRLGIVDFDSSHCIEFTRRFNHVGVDADECVDGARVVLGCPGTSEMNPTRIAGFTEEILTCGVELVETAAEMLGRIDAVLVLSLCGTPHLGHVRPFLEAGVPAFVDKPFACCFDDARKMIQLAQEERTPLVTSSGLRFAEAVTAFQSDQRYGRLQGLVSYGPAKRAEGNPGLFHYGIHPTTVLMTLMGPGCESVSNVCTPEAELVTARWSDGRIATLRGNRAGSTAYGFVAFCENAVVHQSVSTRYAYRNLCRMIVETFTSGQPVVPQEETLEIVRFIEAAMQSEQQNGRAVPLESVG